jgi:hypothetical protein
MTRVKKILLGLDPGGIGNFGWCVAEAGTSLPIHVLATGKADHAQAAILEIQKVLAYTSTLFIFAGVGIDSPLFWTSDGDREADISIRSAIKAKGATNVYGTVQNVNSLRGACLVQGILSARLIRDISNTRITESHPKALLWLLDIASQSLPVEAIEPISLSRLIKFNIPPNSEHERDAALGALSAWYMLHADTSWYNLFDEERFPFAPVPQVEYWMPIMPYSKPHRASKRSESIRIDEFIQEFKNLHPKILTDIEEKAIKAAIMDCESHYAFDNTKLMFSSKYKFYSWLYSELHLHAKLEHANLDFEVVEEAYLFWAKKYHSEEYDELS